MAPLVELKDASVRIGLNDVLAPCSLTIEPGKLWAFIGGNGSGKTVLSELVAGRRRPSSGTVSYKGLSDPVEEIAVVSFESQLRLLRRERKSEESWLLHGATDPGTTVAHYVGNVPDELLDEFRIRHILHRGLRFLSTGEIRKTILCRSLAAHPRLLILDDPYDGLDVDAQAELHATVTQVSRRGTAVVLVVSRESEIEADVTHVARLEAGRVVSAGPLVQDSVGPSGQRSHTSASQSVEATPASTLEIPQFHATEDAEAYRAGRTLIAMRNVNVSYGPTPVLRQVNWTVHAGEGWQIIGPNGAGKTTLLSLVTASNAKAYGQEIELFGRRRGTGESVWEIKEKTGVVSGDFHNTYPLRTRTLEAVLSGFTDSAGLYERPSGYQMEVATQWLGILGLEDLRDERLRNLSYGQQRAVFVARAMVKLPPLLIADEPCQGLDDEHSRLVLSLIDRVANETDTTVLYVSHNPAHVLESTTHHLTLTPGAQGSTAAITSV